MGGLEPAYGSTIDYVTIASTGNAADFGDLFVAHSRSGNSSDNHGGLQSAQNNVVSYKMKEELLQLFPTP